MTNELHLTRRLKRLALAIGLRSRAPAPSRRTRRRRLRGSPIPRPRPMRAGARAGQDPAAAPTPAPSEAAPQPRRDPPLSRGHTRCSSADLSGGGDTLTYTSVAAGVDGHIQTRRVTAQASLRYERDIDWNGHVAQQDNISGLATVHAEVAPGVLSLDAGGLATRTGGAGRVFGVTNRDDTPDVYSLYAGPTLATHAGPLAINGAYRFGYTKVDEHGIGPAARRRFRQQHRAQPHRQHRHGHAQWRPSVRLDVGGGYVRETSNDSFRHRFEGSYARGDVVVPVGPDPRPHRGRRL